MTGLPLWGVTIVDDGDTSTVTLRGELDLAAADELREILTGQLDRSGIQLVAVDLAGVSFLDSAALGALLLAYRHAGDHGRGFVVGGTVRGVRRIMEIAGVYDILAGVESAAGE